VGPLGIPELIIIAAVLIVPVVGLAMVGILIVAAGKRAKRLGYESTRDYLRAAPRTDEEKRDAVDMALKGLALCLLGLLFPPFVLAGLIPLFYGGRKMAYASMGLGLVDDARRPRV
jgi:hypothetical protein